MYVKWIYQVLQLHVCVACAFCALHIRSRTITTLTHYGCHHHQIHHSSAIIWQTVLEWNQKKYFFCLPFFRSLPLALFSFCSYYCERENFHLHWLSVYEFDTIKFKLCTVHTHASIRTYIECCVIETNRRGVEGEEKTLTMMTTTKTIIHGIFQRDCSFHFLDFDCAIVFQSISSLRLFVLSLCSALRRKWYFPSFWCGFIFCHIFQPSLFRLVNPCILFFLECQIYL